jgi:hypothetical protein
MDRSTRPFTQPVKGILPTTGKILFDGDEAGMIPSGGK